MKEKDLPNFPLLFERIGKFLGEATATGPEQESDLMIAREAFNTIIGIIYRAGAVGQCPVEVTYLHTLR